MVATHCCFDARLETCDVNCSGTREETNIEIYSLDPPQSRSSSAPSNFHSSFFSTFIQSQPNYVVPAVQNVHFLFLNVCGLKINYVNMNLFRAERKSWSSQPETMTCRFLQPGLRILHWGFIGGFWNPKLGMMRKSGTNKIQIHFKSWQTTHISHGSNHLCRIYHHLKQMKVRKWFTFHLFLVSN